MLVSKKLNNILAALGRVTQACFIIHLECHDDRILNNNLTMYTANLREDPGGQTLPSITL